jgi:hypothetical protein
VAFTIVVVGMLGGGTGSGLCFCRVLILELLILRILLASG